MLILLPPSERKTPAPRRRAPLDLTSLHHPGLTAQRERTLRAAAAVSAGADALDVLETSLPGLGPLAAAWRPHLAAELDPLVAAGMVAVDARSTTDAAAWTPPREHVHQVALISVIKAVPSGTRTVVSHAAKHARGLVVRHLLTRGGRATSRRWPPPRRRPSTSSSTRPRRGGRAGSPWCCARSSVRGPDLARPPSSGGDPQRSGASSPSRPLTTRAALDQGISSATTSTS